MKNQFKRELLQAENAEAEAMKNYCDAEHDANLALAMYYEGRDLFEQRIQRLEDEGAPEEQIETEKTHLVFSYPCDEVQALDDARAILLEKREALREAKKRATFENIVLKNHPKHFPSTRQRL